MTKKGVPVHLTANFQQKPHSPEDGRIRFSQYWREKIRIKNLASKEHYSTKIFFRYEEEIKTFAPQKFREFNTRLLLQQMLSAFLQTERKRCKNTEHIIFIFIRDMPVVIFCENKFIKNGHQVITSQT